MKMFLIVALLISSGAAHAITCSPDGVGKYHIHSYKNLPTDSQQTTEVFYVKGAGHETIDPSATVDEQGNLLVVMAIKGKVIDWSQAETCYKILDTFRFEITRDTLSGILVTNKEISTNPSVRPCKFPKIAYRPTTTDIRCWHEGR